MKGARHAVVLAFALIVAGCASPANFAGAYSNVVITNGNDMCGLSGWTNGTMTTAPVNIDQAMGASAATLVVNGTAGVYVGVLTGDNHLAGTVSGNDADFSRDGTTMLMNGACAYTLDMDVSIHLSGEQISGTVTYTPRTNHDPSCGLLETCHNTQTVLGTRTTM